MDLPASQLIAIMTPLENNGSMNAAASPIKM
jgi:hypothetical protein